MKTRTLDRIFKLMKENKMNFKEFAQSCSLSPGNITDWKTGRSNPSLIALRKISRRYNVQLEWLTGDSKYRTKQDEVKEIIAKEAEINE